MSETTDDTLIPAPTRDEAMGLMAMYATMTKVMTAGAYVLMLEHTHGEHAIQLNADAMSYIVKLATAMAPDDETRKMGGRTLANLDQLLASQRDHKKPKRNKEPE